MYYVKRDVSDNIIEAKPIGSFPIEELEEWEEIDSEDPELMRFFDPTYSFKTWLKARTASDPILRVICERVRQLAGTTKQEELAIYETICESILPDL